MFPNDFHDKNHLAQTLTQEKNTEREVDPIAAALTTADGVVDVHTVVREYGAFAWRMLRRLGVPDSDVDDACQEVFVVVCRKLSEFEGRSSIKTWLYGICVRTAAAHRRSARVRREVCTDSLPMELAADRPDTSLEEREMLGLLDRALDGLDDDKREVFVLYEIEELAMSDVAQVLGCPVQTAYSRHRVARDQVAAFFRRHSLATRGGGCQ